MLLKIAAEGVWKLLKKALLEEKTDDGNKLFG